jgi:hypothetical protein
MENVRLNSVASYNYCTHVTCEMCRTFSILNVHLILFYVHLEHCLRQENRCIGIVMVCLECVARPFRRTTLPKLSERPVFA